MERATPKKLAARLVRILRHQRPDYNYVKKVFEHVRRDLGFKGRAPTPKKLPTLLTEKELARFYDAVWNVADRTHTVMIKLLLYTGVRNSELANVKLIDVDLNGFKVRIEQGKGNKDRYVPFPPSFRGELAQYMENQTERGATYLFETNRADKFTTRWIREIVKRYAREADIEKRIYPHLFRHQLLTHFSRKGLLDAKVQVISGHESRKSLEIYQELSLGDVQKDYEEAMKDFPVR
jgi:integrase/recombinase XerD